MLQCEWTLGCKNEVIDGHWHYQTDRRHPKWNKRCFTCYHCDPYHRLRNGRCGWEMGAKYPTGRLFYCEATFPNNRHDLARALASLQVPASNHRTCDCSVRSCSLLGRMRRSNAHMSHTSPQAKEHGISIHM